MRQIGSTTPPATLQLGRNVVSLMEIIYVIISVWCNFDHGLCSEWNQSSSDDFDWTLASGSTPSTSTGPTHGHGGSGWLYLFFHSC